MDLQTAKIANRRLLRVARAATLVCFALAGMLLALSLQTDHKTGFHGKGVALSIDRGIRAL
jgi:hypothetical protein